MGGDNREKPGNEVAHVNEFAEGQGTPPAKPFPQPRRGTPGNSTTTTSLYSVLPFCTGVIDENNSKQLNLRK